MRPLYGPTVARGEAELWAEVDPYLPVANAGFRLSVAVIPHQANLYLNRETPRTPDSLCSKT